MTVWLAGTTAGTTLVISQDFDFVSETLSSLAEARRAAERRGAGEAPWITVGSEWLMVKLGKSSR